MSCLIWIVLRNRNGLAEKFFLLNYPGRHSKRLFPRHPPTNPLHFSVNVSSDSEHGWCSSCADWRVCHQVPGYLGLRGAGKCLASKSTIFIESAVYFAKPFPREDDTHPWEEQALFKHHLAQKGGEFWRSEQFLGVGKNPGLLPWGTRGRWRSAFSAFCPKYCR